MTAAERYGRVTAGIGVSYPCHPCTQVEGMGGRTFTGILGRPVVRAFGYLTTDSHMGADAWAQIEVSTFPSPEAIRTLHDVTNFKTAFIFVLDPLRATPRTSTHTQTRGSGSPHLHCPKPST